MRSDALADPASEDAVRDAASREDASNALDDLAGEDVTTGEGLDIMAEMTQELLILSYCMWLIGATIVHEGRAASWNPEYHVTRAELLCRPCCRQNTRIKGLRYSAP
ncbi:hypothetical protein HPB47_013425 [Ixodes persulcatus]|uniref:Uncharacterized protein n=1 Tax=Ixodes persulcatus TaxID=34615 RepID=A0AC60QYR1_IXOPE|nr:hypothetical protein HPB47_013425 [Ixodes persulcatus]